MSTGPYQHNGSVEACTAFLASQHRPKPTDSERLAKTTDRNGDVLVGDILDIIDKDPSRYRVAQALAKYVRERDQQRLSAVDRFEVIDETRRAYVKGSIYGSPVKVELSYQNDGKTLKAFVTAALDPDNSSVEEKDARD